MFWLWELDAMTLPTFFVGGFLVFVGSAMGLQQWRASHELHNNSTLDELEYRERERRIQIRLTLSGLFMLTGFLISLGGRLDALFRMSANVLHVLDGLFGSAATAARGHRGVGADRPESDGSSIAAHLKPGTWRAAGTRRGTAALSRASSVSSPSRFDTRRRSERAAECFIELANRRHRRSVVIVPVIVVMIVIAAAIVVV